MRGSYNQIIRIERIQNERWYMQYLAHRQDFLTRLKMDTEQRLFHGCPEQAASSIIEGCFNRSYAGINGEFCSSSERWLKVIYRYCIGGWSVFLLQCHLQPWLCETKCQRCAMYVHRSYSRWQNHCWEQFNENPTTRLRFYLQRWCFRHVSRRSSLCGVSDHLQIEVRVKRTRCDLARVQREREKRHSNATSVTKLQ